MARIGFLGTGLMGTPMVRRLARAGHDLRVWNRTPGKAAVLAAPNVEIVAAARDVARGAEIVICMVSTGDVCKSVLLGAAGVLAAMPPGAVLVVTSSISVPDVRDIATEAAQCGVACLDAPVSGGVAGAEAGTLAIMAGGTEAAFMAVREVLMVLGRPVLVGLSSAGALAKLANQMIVAGTIALVSEAFVLAERGGADLVKLREALTGGFADSIILQRHGQRMIERDFTPGGPAKYQVKDTQAALALAAEHGLDLPVTWLVDALFHELLASGDGDLDHSALIRQVRRRSGFGV